MSELFPIESMTQDSPRLQWMKRHGVQTHFTSCGPSDDNDWQPWVAAFGDPFQVVNQDGDEAMGFGHTEDEAIRNLACIHQVRLWNEE